MKPLRMMISAVLAISCLLCLPKSGSINASTLDVGPIGFDGSFNLTKSVDANGDDIFDDSGKQVNVGDTLKYKIDWSFDNPNSDPLIDPYVYDTVPAGTHYLAGSATPLNDLSYSTDNGSSWTPGEPPDGSQAGTMLRWGPIPSGWVGANGSRYLGNYTTHPNDINASSNPGTSSGYATGVCLQYDSQNNPHICWSDNEYGNGDIYYIRWDNKKSNWVCADGSLYVPMSNGRQNVSRNTGQSGYPRFALDKNDNPCITWIDDSYVGFSWEVLFVRWNPSINDWVCADQSVYVPGSNGHENVSRNSNLSRSPMIKIDSKNNPHIAWDDGLNSFVENDIYYVKWDDTIKNWVGADNIIYIPNTNGSHNVTPSTIDSDLESFDLDTGDNPHLTWASYLGSPINLVSYVRYSQTMGWICADGSAYSPGNNAQYINTLNTRSLYSFVDTDANDMPHIVWTQSKSNNWGINGDEDIYYIKWDLGKNNWICADGSVYNPLSPGSANISNTAGASIFPAIQLNSKGIPNIIWEDWTFGTGDVFLVAWDSNQGKWVDFNGDNYDGSINGNANVTKNNGQYKFPSISINSSDNPGIVWLDNRLSKTESFFVQKAPCRLSFDFSIKIDNQFKDSSIICNQAEFWHAFDKGNHVKSNNVCNTINYNFTGKIELTKSVDANGDDIFDDSGKQVNVGDTLKYKIDWSFDNPNSDPLIDPYVYDTVPAGTHYLAGSATPLNDLSYSTDNGSSWTPGEPPDGSQAGTMLRWGPIPQGWTTAGNIPFDPVVNNALVSSTAAQVSLALDPNGRPCMAFSDYIGYSGSRYDIFFVKWDGARWVGVNGQPYDPLTGANANVSKAITDSDGASLAIDKYGYPCIAWGEKIHPDVITSWEIFFVRWNGYMWVNAQGEQYDGSNANVSNTPSTSYGVSLAIDDQNNPNLVWYDYYGSTYSFDINFLKWDGTAWVNVQDVPYNGVNAGISKTSSSSEFPVLRLDNSGNPCVSWSEGSYGGYDVVYIRWNGTTWVGANGLPYDPVTGANANVSRNGGYSSYPSLCLDESDNPNIVWHDYSYGGTAIVSVKWDGTQWVGANGMLYDPATGANGIVAMNAVIGGGPSNPTRLAAKITCIDIDDTGNQCVSWWGNIAGNRGIYFARWDGTRWIGGNKQPFDPITGANAYTGGGFDAQYTNFANAISMAMGDLDEPFIGWYNQTPDLYTASLIKYLPPTAPRSFGFSAIVEETPVDSQINNQAFSRHALDQGVPALSNNVAVNIKKPVKKAVLEVTKKAKAFQYNIDDIFAFQITVRNIGNLDATNVVLDDVFPRELKYVSSLPSGAAGPSKVRYQVGNLSPGQSKTYLLKFSLAKSLSFAGNCLTITNKASAMSDSAEPVADYATISVCKQPPTKEIVLDVTWKGINTKTNEARANEEIKLDLSVEGGAPPYEIVVNWGNGNKSTKTMQDKDDLVSFENSYSSQGDFEVLIICVDSFGRSARQSRVIHIK